MKNINELKKGVKELVIALLKCKPTKDKEIIDFNVRAFMGGFEDYLSNQSELEEILMAFSLHVVNSPEDSDIDELVISFIEDLKQSNPPIKEQGETKSTSPTEVKVDYIEPECEICKHFGKPEEYPCNDCSTQSVHFKPKELEEKVICPHCTAKISQEELDMFGGYCEACNEELDH